MKTNISIRRSLIAFTLLGSVSSQAAIVASGIRDLAISNTFQGLYLDVDAGTVVAEETVGWDINPFFSGEAVANSPSFQPVRTTVNVSSAILNLSFGQTVNTASIFASGYAGSDTHVGNGIGKFVSGSEGFIGFKLTTNGGSGPYFGWMRLTLSNTGSGGVIHEWAYEDSGTAITVGAIPEPSALALWIAGTGCLILRRKRLG